MTNHNFLRKPLNRRRFLGTTAAGLALAGAAGPQVAFGAADTVKIGFLAPLTGEVAAWGLPGLYGCQIWAETYQIRSRAAVLLR